MSEITRILQSIEAGQAAAAEQLLPLVYEELRKLAAAHLINEQPGQTLQPTALVHEAYLRLVGGANPEQWNSRGHFFAAAAVAIRRNPGRKRPPQAEPQTGRGIHTAGIGRIGCRSAGDQRRPARAGRGAAETYHRPSASRRTVQLVYFSGLSQGDASQVLGISPRTAGRLWTYARAWLRREIEGTSARILAESNGRLRTVEQSHSLICRGVG